MWIHPGLRSGPILPWTFDFPARHALGRMAYEERAEEDTFPSLGTWQLLCVMIRRPPCAHDIFIEENRSPVTSVPTDPLILVALLQAHHLNKNSVFRFYTNMTCPFFSLSLESFTTLFWWWCFEQFRSLLGEFPTPQLRKQCAFPLQRLWTSLREWNRHIDGNSIWSICSPRGDRAAFTDFCLTWHVKLQNLPLERRERIFSP